MATGKTESSTKTAETKPSVAGGWILRAPRPEYRHHVWVYNFVAERPQAGR